MATKEDLYSLETRILLHFDVTLETIRHDLTGANLDRISLLDDRVTRLETHVGLKSS